MRPPALTLLMVAEAYLDASDIQGHSPRWIHQQGVILADFLRYRVQWIPFQERGTVPPRDPSWGPKAPILVTANPRDWLVKDPNPMTLGVNLVNVRPILRHHDGCANVVIRALTVDVPSWEILWCDFDPDGRRHLMLFVRE